MNQYQYEVGDIVKLKKQHPCGSHEWEILRVGADFRLKCTGCGHQIMIANVREIVLFTFTPMSCAASLSSDTASIA